MPLSGSRSELIIALTGRELMGTWGPLGAVYESS